MAIKHLEITSFRNLISVNTDFSTKFNLCYGDNGAGKTSLLEAIYFLSYGRSFRTSYNKRIISNNHPTSTLHAKLASNDSVIPLGVEFNDQGQKRIRINNQDNQQRSKLAKLFPLQLIDTHSYRILEQGPKFRRQFLDWGVFHVEPRFLQQWQNSQRILQQRNALLKQRASFAQIQLWDQELSTSGEILHQFRSDYYQRLLPIVKELVTNLLPEIPIDINYYPGWDTTKNLAELLSKHHQRDLQLGYTSIGPHRADITLTVEKIPAQDILSRGQEKTLVTALQLAQGIQLQQTEAGNCTYLIDDLPSELDKQKRHKIIELLQSIGAQVFISGINKTDLTSLFTNPTDYKLFHVKQGEIAADILHD